VIIKVTIVVLASIWATGPDRPSMKMHQMVMFYSEVG
jgi:hypothetical protein